MYQLFMHYVNRNAMTSQEVVDFVKEKINQPPYTESPSMICEKVCSLNNSVIGHIIYGWKHLLKTRYDI